MKLTPSFLMIVGSIICLTLHIAVGAPLYMAVVFLIFAFLIR